MKPQIGKHGVVEIKEYPYGVFHDRKPEDFDYPMSETFYEYTEERYGLGGANIEQRRSSRTDGESGSIEGSTSLAPLTRVEQTPAPSKYLERLTKESITRSIENRRDLQEHFKLHHTLEKKKPSSYSYIYKNIVLDTPETDENVAEIDPNV